MRPRSPQADAGFTLVEVIIALSILAIATVSLIRATEAHVDLIGGVRERVIAQWVAENRLAEMELAHGAPDGSTTAEMMGAAWRVDVQSRPTDDPDLLAVTVRVRRDRPASPTMSLGGFVDRGG